MNKKSLLLIRWMAVVMFSVLVPNLGLVPEVEAATVIVVNRDSAGEGFNDPTSFTPVGGNTATTLGRARLNAFQHAANIWGRALRSNVPIRVEAQMNPLPANVLGAAGALNNFRDFTNAPVANTWHPVALANSLANMDIDPSRNDIRAQFSSTHAFYFGLDGRAPSNQHDFVTVVLHEIGHGLGFATLVDSQTGEKALGRNDAYMRFLEHHGRNPSGYPGMSNAQRRAAAVSGPLLHFLGPRVQAGSGVLTAGKTGTHVHMYAPNPVKRGSSVSHFALTTTPNQLMEPALARGPGNHNLGLALNLLEDIGWQVTTGGGSNVPPPILTPAPNSTLAPNASIPFTGGRATGAIHYFAFVGTTKGARNIQTFNLRTTPTFTVRTPASGIMHVRYWTRFATGGINNTGWTFTDQQYRIGPGGGSNVPPAILTPRPGSTLPINTRGIRFTGGKATGELQHFLWLGSTKGSSALGTLNLRTNNTFLINTGSRPGTFWIRYWTRFATGGVNNTGWVFTDQQYFTR